MTNISKENPHHNVRNYFNKDSQDFGANFATCRPPWSSIQSFIRSAKIMEKDKLVSKFPVAKRNLMVALICSDYACLGWCKLS
jgi:hypothetical protein